MTVSCHGHGSLDTPKGLFRCDRCWILITARRQGDGTATTVPVLCDKFEHWTVDPLALGPTPTKTAPSTVNMSFWSCTISDCTKESLFIDGACQYCGARLCRDHAGRVDFHPCEGIDGKARYELYLQARRTMVSILL